ncbi:MAG TPA: Fic family protein, partial [Planctomycetaceae bacterium]|nr:Fic family protein [Planctomycetaceae bacterium]
LVEAENIRKVVVKYLAAKPSRRMAPFDLAWGLKLHAEMFGDVWDWAGTPRQKDLNLGVPWYQVQSALKNAFDDLAFWKANWPDVLEQAVHLHHRSVQVHPFLNGNGRWARMLSNIWLRLHDSPITVWPEETVGSVSEIRDEYIEAVRDADNGQFEPLIELHRKFLDKEGGIEGTQLSEDK